MMSGSDFRILFPDQLKFWSVRCGVNALPGMLIAMRLGEFWGRGGAIAGMLVAVVVLILACAVGTTLIRPLREDGGVIFRAMQMGLMIRFWLSVVSLIGLVFLGDLRGDYGLMLLIPDVYAGIGAALATDSLMRLFGRGSIVSSIFDGNAGFLEVLLLGGIYGLVIGFGVFVMGVISVVFIQRKERMKAFL